MDHIRRVERLGKYITVKSAAERSGLAYRTINYLANVGRIAAVRFNGTLGIDMQSLDEYIATQRKTENQRSERG